MTPEQISGWVKEMRESSNGTFQLNTWIPDPQPIRDLKHENSIKKLISKWEPEVSNLPDNLPSQDFELQCEAMLKANPTIISSIMGLYPSQFVSSMRNNNIKWFATVTLSLIHI